LYDEGNPATSNAHQIKPVLCDALKEGKRFYYGRMPAEIVKIKEGHVKIRRIEKGMIQEPNWNA
jgi:hypothetical protein